MTMSIQDTAYICDQIKGIFTAQRRQQTTVGFWTDKVRAQGKAEVLKGSKSLSIAGI